jgi:hypothetical protein
MPLRMPFVPKLASSAPVPALSLTTAHPLADVPARYSARGSKPTISSMSLTVSNPVPTSMVLVPSRSNAVTSWPVWSYFVTANCLSPLGKV